MTQLNLEIKTKLDELDQMLTANHPGMGTLLRDIHKTLKSQPDIVTLMSEDEIAVIVRGLDKQTGAHIAAAVMKPSKVKKESLKNVTVDELGF